MISLSPLLRAGPARPHRRFPFAALLLACLALAPGGLAQQPPADPPAAAAPDPAAPPVPAAPPAADRQGLRQLDTPTPPAASPGRRREGPPLGNHHVPAGRTQRDVVALFGSSVVEGRVTGDAVSILGRTRVEPGGQVGGAAVAVLGRVDSLGQVGRDAVSVLGATSIDGPVGGDVVTVLGNLHLGPKAVIARDVVVVGGRLERDPAAEIRGEVVHLPFLPGGGDFGWLSTWFERCLLLGRPLAFGAQLGWAWVIAGIALGFHLLVSLLFPRAVTRCAQTLETRPVGSVVTLVLTVILTPVAIVLLAITLIGTLVVPLVLLGLFFGAIFGKTVMLAWLGRRVTQLGGAGAGGAPVLAVLLGGVLVTLLYTVPVVGFLAFKLLSWLGLGVVVYTVALAMRRETPAAPLAAGAAPAGAVASGVVPGPVPFHAAPVAAAASPAPAAEIPATVAVPVPPTLPPADVPASPPPVAGFSVMTPTRSSAAAEPPAAAGSGPLPPPPPPSAVPAPPVSPALAWPRVGFGLRLAALALDAILVGMILSLVSDLLPRFLQFKHGPGGLLIVLAIYAACLWRLRGTTIGGIVCGLKVVRLDQREVDWATAIVRALGCFLSLVVGGLGFIWVAFDDEKQSWHDKIAGTTVVRVPKGTPLV